ncbi:MAG: hypothetical protein ACSHXD_19925 [Marinosulfonomonas sp.]
MQNFAASVRKHVKNTGTKPVQAIPVSVDAWRHQEKKNPRSAATETGIKSLAKASSFQVNSSSNWLFKANGNSSACQMMAVAV